MDSKAQILLGWSDQSEGILLNRANRHGVVAGATGTGKTVTLQVLAQAFCDAGVPVFAADVKGDLAGASQPGDRLERFAERAQLMNLELKPAAPPVIFWDIFGKQGHPIRATVSEMGPLLLSRMLDLNDTQEGVLNIAFRVADDEGLLLLDLKDLQSAIRYVGENATSLSLQYGNIAPATIGAIQRALLALESQGAEHFFGEPALQLADLLRTDLSGRGYMNILAADMLIRAPKLYATFLLWLLSELFEELPEVGDPEKPRLVFFFDEAHFLFRDTPRVLLEKIELVVRLIRSKGVGVYFVTQNPSDIPDSVLAQLGNRVQHALRAYTPAEQRGLRAAADSFRTNPDFDTATVIQALSVGEALVSTLDAKGVPTMVHKTMIRPPVSRLGAISEQERQQILGQSPVRGLYDRIIDRESAHEILQKRAAAAASQKQAELEAKNQAKQAKAEQKTAERAPRATTSATSRPSTRESIGEAFAKSLARSVASSAGRRLIRGVLGSLLK